MKWNRLKRRIRLKPDLIDPYRSISHREARRIWRKEGRPGVFEVLEGARKKAGKTPEEWEALTGLRQKQAYPAPGAAVRRWTVACAVVLLIGAFLAFTAPGRAFAAKVYQTFTTIAENILNIRATEERNTSDVEPNAGVSEDERIKLSSLDEAAKQADHDLLYLANKEFLLESIDIRSSQVTGLIVWSKYKTPDKITIIIQQRWPLNGQKAELDLLFENATYYASISPTGLIFQGAYTKDDQTYLGGAIQDNMLITINISPVSQPEGVNPIIEKLGYYKK